MKRLLTLVGFTYLLTTASALFLGARAAILLAFLFAGGGVLSMALVKKADTRQLTVLLLSAAAAFFLFYGHQVYRVNPITSLSGSDGQIEGYLCELPEEYNGNYRYLIQVERVNGEEKSFKLLYSTGTKTEAPLCAKVRASVSFVLPPKTASYNIRNYMASQNVFLYAYSDAALTVSSQQEKTACYYALLIREKIKTAVRALFPEQSAGLISGTLMGDRSLLSEQIEENFQLCGVSHLLAVSGIHMATMSQLILFLLLFLRVPKRASAFLSALGILLFMAVTGFAPSAVRSGIMQILYLMGLVIGLSADSLTSLGIAMLLICLINPFAPGNIGLILSFLATLGIILLGKRTRVRLLRRFENHGLPGKIGYMVTYTVSISCSAILFTLPAQILYFGEISLIAPLSNLLLVYPCTVMIQFALVGAVLWFIPYLELLAKAFALLANVIAVYMLRCSELLASIPYASVRADYGFVKLWLAATLLLIGLLCIFRLSLRKKFLAAALSVFILLAGIVSHQIVNAGTTQVCVFDTGEGCSVLITKDGESALIGCGGQYGKLSFFLDEYAAGELVWLQATETKWKEQENFKLLCENYFPTKSSYVPAESRKQEIMESVFTESYFAKGIFYVRIYVEKVTFLLCRKGTASRNDVMIVYESSGAEKEIVVSEGTACVGDKTVDYQEAECLVMKVKGDTVRFGA